MSEANWNKISDFFGKHPIRKTKELLCWCTFNPYKASPRFNSWQKISTCSDYLRKYSRCFVVVKGLNQDGSSHYHAICYLEPIKIPLISKSKMFNVDVKEWTFIDKTNYTSEAFDEEYIEATDELAEEYKLNGTVYNTVDIILKIGYNRALRDLMVKKPKIDAFTLENLSKYCIKNMKECISLPEESEWKMYRNIVLFPNNK